MDKTILLVEDDNRVTRNNAAALKPRGIEAGCAENLAQARTLLKEREFNAAVLDIMLPDGSGLDLLREIRSASTLPVLLLTGKGKSDEVILGLSLGADDYLAKPYLIGVFTARVEALLRRAAIVSESVTVGHLRFNMLTNRAYYDSADLLLTQKEFTLLLLLARGGGKTLTFEYLFEKAWGQPMLGDTAPLRVQISGLARKLSAVTDNAVVESVRKRGYRLVSARS